MTRVEAIKLLTQYINYDAETPDYYEMEKACKVALKALEQEPCEDAISREELLKAIDTWDRFGVDDTNSLFRLDNLSLPHYVSYIHAVLDKAIYTETENGWCGRTVDVKDVESLPPVTPKPKTGHWIEEKSEVYKCSNCGSYALEWGGKLKMSRYCPNCGAKMLPTDSEKEWLSQYEGKWVAEGEDKE